MTNAILNFHFDYWHTSLRDSVNRIIWSHQYELRAVLGSYSPELLHCHVAAGCSVCSCIFGHVVKAPKASEPLSCSISRCDNTFIVFNCRLSIQTIRLSMSGQHLQRLGDRDNFQRNRGQEIERWTSFQQSQAIMDHTTRQCHRQHHVPTFL